MDVWCLRGLCLMLMARYVSLSFLVRTVNAWHRRGGLSECRMRWTGLDTVSGSCGLFLWSSRLAASRTSLPTITMPPLPPIATYSIPD